MILNRLLFIVLILTASFSKATESDPYTYSCIDLKDSRDDLNVMINYLLYVAVHNANNSRLGTDRQKDSAELSFSRAYEAEHGKNINEDGAVFSVLEACIDSGGCPGFPQIERIVLRDDESIFAKSKYSWVTRKYSAAILNVCGVRISSDKLTHMLYDGFKYYNYSKDIRHPLTREEVYSHSLVHENWGMGKSLTRVISYADIEANLAGFDFFNNLFNGENPYLQEVAGFIRVNKHVDICDYVTDKWSEKINPNTYTSSPKKKRALKAAIKDAEENCNLSPEEKEQILSRKVTEAELKISKVDSVRAFFQLLPKYFLSAKTRKAIKIFTYKSKEKYRENTTGSK